MCMSCDNEGLIVDTQKGSTCCADCSEGQLSELFSHHGAVREVRMVRDKFTGAPRGFAFVHFNTVAEAAHALQHLQARHPVP